MKKNCLPTLPLLLLAGCSGASDHIHESSKWHDQLVVEGSVELEGYVLRSTREKGIETIVMLKGKEYTCRNGNEDRFVLEDDLAVVVFNGDKLVSVSNGLGEKGVGQLAPDELGAMVQRVRELKARLPMLFDAKECMEPAPITT